LWRDTPAATLLKHQSIQLQRKLVELEIKQQFIELVGPQYNWMILSSLVECRQVTRRSRC
jgi:hypothetical protein